MADYFRIRVSGWDADYIYGGSVKVALHGYPSLKEDWSYLLKILRKGCQLNIVCPHEEDGVLYPEFIIFEPDYLVDISTIASCFTSFADSPFVHLLHKLEPSASSESIVLGNFAGQLLDESIHQLPSDHTYSDSVKDFFAHNSLSLLTTDIGPQFHAEAQNQKRNIDKAIHETLPHELGSFDSRLGFVEPSFFSEMLGLQGRMDYLQLDMKVLLEQKSGRGGYPYDDFQTPRRREEHYVQLLLYMMLIKYNFSDVYEKQNLGELHAYLLYTKYANSLLALDFSPELMFLAMKIRNTLVWTEFLYTQPDGFRLLETLTPEKFNLKHIDGKLWHNYQSVRIARLLSPIHEASPLEREYYFRFLRFIACEHMLSKLGNHTPDTPGFASIWQNTLEEKLAQGNIYCNLHLELTNLESRLTTLTLYFAEDECNNMSNFRIGDIVILYPYSEGTVPDARKTMVFRSTIVDLHSDSITLRLRAPQTDARVFEHESGKLWAIEHDFMESSYSGLYRGMQAFLSAPKERRDLILLQREPLVDKSLVLKGEYGRFDELSLRIKQARDIFLIIGPPGTGKTSYGLLNTVKEELLEENSSILLTAFTNRAVDEICGKLAEAGIDFIRVGSETNCAAEYRDRLLSSKVAVCNNLSEVRYLVRTQRVFVGTTTAFTSSLSIFQLRQFSLAIIDEASQILEPHLMALLSATCEGQSAISRFVMIGDHKQLPAVVQQSVEESCVDSELLRSIHLTDCRVSLFERLLRRYGDDPQVVGQLTKQGRMHPDIAEFPNRFFYNSQLEIVPLQHQLKDLPSTVRFFPSELPQNSVSDKVNQVEADMIADMVKKIYEQEKDCFDKDDTVGVIVPYRNQIATIRTAIDRFNIPELHDITIDTVERYQGSQRRYIIYGFTVQKPYQLEFLTNNVFVDTDGTLVDRKLNVAMTRAKEHLFIVGNPQLLSTNNLFRELIEFLS